MKNFWKSLPKSLMGTKKGLQSDQSDAIILK